MLLNAPRMSLPEAITTIFDTFAARDGARSEIRTAEEWSALLSEITAAGLLPQPEACHHC